MRKGPWVEALSERNPTEPKPKVWSRALPVGRDGLKRVHRRLLYAMRQLQLDP